MSFKIPKVGAKFKAAGAIGVIDGKKIAGPDGGKKFVTSSRFPATDTTI
jgi:hypothetical protein